jgi:hypothetical protein
MTINLDNYAAAGATSTGSELRAIDGTSLHETEDID